MWAHNRKPEAIIGGNPGSTLREDRPLSITAIILAYNEEIHIARCLSRIAPLVQRIVVVDSYSNDRTVDLARQFGAEVLQNRWRNYADQFDWAIRQACPDTDWILRLDCDEYLEETTQNELRSILPKLPKNVTGLEFRLKVIFRGRHIRFGRYYSTWLLRLWRNGSGEIEQRWMDEHIILKNGEAIRLRGGDLVDHNLNDIGWWIEKHNQYATRHMIEFINKQYPLFAEDKRLITGKTSAWVARFLKVYVYGRSPLYLRAVLFFIYRYFVRLGFLDGKIGFLFHFMHGFWLYMLIDAKIDEARRYISENGLEAFKDRLRSRYKIEL